MGRVTAVLLTATNETTSASVSNKCFRVRHTEQHSARAKNKASNRRNMTNDRVFPMNPTTCIWTDIFNFIKLKHEIEWERNRVDQKRLPE